MRDLESNEEIIRNDYIGEDDLLYCGNCHTRKEFKIVFEGREQIIPVCCECEKEQRRKISHDCHCYIGAVAGIFKTSYLFCIHCQFF